MTNEALLNVYLLNCEARKSQSLEDKKLSREYNQQLRQEILERMGKEVNDGL